MIIITGASDGLGLEIAKQFVANGKKAISLSRTRPTDPSIEWLKTDLEDNKSIEEAVSGILQMNEPIDALINNAAVTSYEDMDALTQSELEKMFNTNVVGPIFLTSKLLQRIKEDGADIVNIGATIALKAGLAQQSVYSSTKWALRGFTQNLAEDLKPTSCRVVSFILGGFNSKMHQKVTGGAIADPENWMKPEDIASLLLQVLALPKNMEISEIIVNRKARR